jgi:hypothetical protein
MNSILNLKVSITLYINSLYHIDYRSNIFSFIKFQAFFSHFSCRYLFTKLDKTVGKIALQF